MNKLDLLESGGITRIILFLYDHPEGSLRAFYRSQIGLSPRAAMRNHDLLFEAGLLETVTHPSRLLFKLSPKGIKIANYLKEIEKVLQNDK